MMYIYKANYFKRIQLKMLSKTLVALTKQVV